MKICTKCNISKGLEFFSNISVNKDVLKSSCKDCDKELTQEYYKEYYRRNKESLSKYKKQNYIENKDLYLKNAENCREKNRYIYLEYLKEWRKDNKEYTKEYWILNKDKKKIYNKEYRDKYPHIETWRSSLKSALKRLVYKKESSTIDILNYSANDLRNHMKTLFEDGMSCNNWGERYIDHKIPLSRSKENTPIHIVNSLDNLQPLWAVDNLSKSNKLYE